MKSNKWSVVLKESFFFSNEHKYFINKIIRPGFNKYNSLIEKKNNFKNFYFFKKKVSFYFCLFCFKTQTE